MEQEKHKVAKNKKIAENQKFKEEYFSRYDDIKSHTHDVYDW